MPKLIQSAKNAAAMLLYGLRGAPLQMGKKRLRVHPSLRSWQMGGEDWMFERMQESLRPGDLFADVGANYGFHALLASSLVGPTGRVVAFEPIAGNARLLRKNCALNKCGSVVVVAETAVSDRPEKFLEMGVADSGEDVTASLASRPEHRMLLRVANMSLDDYEWPKGMPLRMIKVDVEGAELSVLRSAKKLLEGHRPLLLVEVHRDLLGQFGTCVEDFERYVKDLGYVERSRQEVSANSDHCYHAFFAADARA